MFICGNDVAAKRTVASICNQFSWDVEDMGAVEAARDRAALHALVHSRNCERRPVAARVQAAQVGAALAGDIGRDARPTCDA